MIKSRLWKLFYCLCGSCLIIVFLQSYSNWKNEHPNGFVRLNPNKKILGIRSIDIKSSGFYIAGMDSQFVYLGLRNQLSELLKLDYIHYNSLKINIEAFNKLYIYAGTYLRVDDSFVYLFDGVKPLIRATHLMSRKSGPNLEMPYFTAAVPLKLNTYILRVAKNRQNYLAKSEKGKISSLIKLEEQGSGIFSTDGSLLKSTRSDTIFYVYNYRNQFLALDSNLSILFKGKTIDTISQAQIEVSRISSERKLTMSAPPLIVNRRCAVNDQFLFVQSEMKADNETNNLHKNTTTIDIYSSKNGKYQFSFHLPDFEGKKLTDFKVYGKTLAALFDHYLYIYHLNF